MHYSPEAIERRSLKIARIHYNQIKQHYLSRRHTVQQWQAVCENPQQFNRAWRAMLQLPINDKPPPEDYRA